MTRSRRPSKATKLTLIALFGAPTGMYGYEIMRKLGIKPGTLYPMLARLEDQAILVSRWQEPSIEGRPPRHIYTLTEAGRVVAKRLTDESRLASTKRLKPKLS